MKANELKVGNYIQLYRKPTDSEMTKHKVVSIFYDVTNEPEYFVELEDGFQINIDTGIVPIPLTEEILLKCGFEANDHKSTYRHDDLYVELCVNIKEKKVKSYGDCTEAPYPLWGLNKIEHSIIPDTYYNGKIYLTVEVEYLISNNPIEYVHQLQNLFFALTGKELEIILS